MKKLIAKNYAQALFELTKEAKKLNEVLAEIDKLIHLFTVNSEFMDVLVTSELDKKEKKVILKQTFNNYISCNLFNCLNIMVEHNTTYLILQVLKHLRQIINQELNIQEGIVYSTTNLTITEMKELTINFSKKLQQKIVFKNYLDQEMIGGIKVVIDDKIYDGSILRSLTELNIKLINQKGINYGT